MWQLLVKIVVNAVAIWVAAAIVPGVDVSGDDTVRTILTLLLIGAVFGLVNAVVKFLIPFEGCLFVITLGISALIINAAVLELTAYLSRKLDLSFTIDDFFWSAVLAALVVSIVSTVLNVVLPDQD